MNLCSFYCVSYYVSLALTLSLSLSSPRSLWSHDLPDVVSESAKPLHHGNPEIVNVLTSLSLALFLSPCLSLLPHLSLAFALSLSLARSLSIAFALALPRARSLRSRSPLDVASTAVSEEDKKENTAHPTRCVRNIAAQSSATPCPSTPVHTMLLGFACSPPPPPLLSVPDRP